MLSVEYVRRCLKLGGGGGGGGSFLVMHTCICLLLFFACVKHNRNF